VKSKMNSVFSLALILSILLSGCAAAQIDSAVSPQLQPVGFYTTLVGIRSAVACAPGTFLMENKDVVMAAWPFGGNYAFASFSKTGKPIVDLMAEMGGNGQRTDVFTMSSLTRYLEDNGWRYITPDRLPLPLLATLKSYAAVSLENAPQTFTTILVVPLSENQINAPSNGVAQ
jgi:hypothetical protein